MFQQFPFRICFGKAVLAAVVTALTTVAAASAQQDRGHDGHSHGSGATVPNGLRGQSNGVGMVRAAAGQHGGQVTATTRQVFEVVYQSQETRVYVYDLAQRPLSARSARGEIVMRVHGNSQEYRYPLQHAAPSGQHDYLVALVDVSRVRDGDMTVEIVLANLPSRKEPSARFTQTFALSRRTLTVTLAAITELDRPAIAKQRTCLVTDEALGSMGTPIKVLIGGQPIYLCCKGCVSKVRKNPEFYLKKARGSVQAQHGSVAPQIRVTQATANDQAAIRAQGVCPVTEEDLGSMGTPIKISIDGQALYVCCKGCVRKVEKNPKVYLAKAAQLRRAR